MTKLSKHVCYSLILGSCDHWLLGFYGYEILMSCSSILVDMLKVAMIVLETSK